MAWKKIILSGSVGELNRAVVTNDVVASSVNAGALTGSLLADNGVVSGSVQVTLTDTTGFSTYSSSVSASIAAKPSDWESLENKPSGIVSSSAQTVANLSNQDVDFGTGAITASGYSGDGSGLSNLTIAQTATVVETFTNQTSVTTTHNFGSKNVLVTVYDNSDFQIFPASIQADSDDTVTFTFDVATSGKVIVGQGGHIVSGSVPFDNITLKPTLVSGSSQVTIQSTDGFSDLQSNISASFSVSSSADAHLDFHISQLSASAHTARGTIDSSFTLAADNGSNDTFTTGNTLTFAGTANEIETTVSDDTITIGIPSSPTLTGNVTITGDLVVQGDTIEQQVTNLNVEDKFILINSGSTASDAGLVVDGAGVSFGWDQSAGRWAFDRAGAVANQTAITSDAFAAAVVTSDDSNYQQGGNIRLDGEDIYIYS